MTEISQLAEENDRLRAALRDVTDKLAMLLEDRSTDDKDAGWWDDRVASVQHAYAVLAGVSFSEWRNNEFSRPDDAAWSTHL